MSASDYAAASLVEKGKSREFAETMAKIGTGGAASVTDASRSKSLEKPSSNLAYSAAQKALDESKVHDNYIYYRRYASEAAARATIGNGAVALDVAAKGHLDGYYPTYDISSHSEVASIKTHWSSDGKLTDSALNAYIRDFAHVLGWGRQGGALEIDGRNIIRARDQGIPVPEQLANATSEDAGIYLRDHSILRIPDDHVGPVRAALEQKVRTFPSNYYLPENPTDVQVKTVLNRVQGIGLTSAILNDIIERKMRGR